ncbi:MULTISPECIES: NUDIX hydrolase [Aurantimicrobium]|jgi:8-oxo-dGTP diphosphatase|uniref:Mutator protein MutT4 n=1 Tax=Aurantimicrobium photophilum TaxID=1987356 RepID=A0A2Z3S185_9MICO|nr:MULTISPECIES: NUDIX domain-containing protein [Aurantimicrobium]AWR22034.1 Putative mutator protein MutT4 [Aurantimicrobium photophilum]MDH6537372.1 8-oxo-dGTP pyrophosphatase MutT (NUDIX family)/phosphohistidine phosphatase SixA [Aurantimicrobium minutum]
MSTAHPTTVYAAGAVLWRIIGDDVHVLVIHRTEHKDISLPKGKVDPGETLPQTAVREIREETGIKVALGVPLGATEYVMPNGKNKFVQYWAAEVTTKAIQKSKFVPNDEVAALEWLPLASARGELSYEPDKEILDNFAALVKDGVTKTFAVVVLRHGKATSPSDWRGEDATRPLTERGLTQAHGIVRTIAAWKPKRFISSTAARCKATIAPVAKALGKDVKSTNKISQDAFESGKADVRSVVGQVVRKRKSSVICTHGPVAPAVIRELALATGTPRSAALDEASMLDTASFTVVHLSSTHPSSGIIAVETHDSQL